MTCASCGAENETGRKFCGECGGTLLERAADLAQDTRVAERRLVSVLFVDLVGFTTASESRDAEDTRELLTRYFELARTTIERYGGTVEQCARTWWLLVGTTRQRRTTTRYALANARNLGYAFWLAPVLHDYGAWLVSSSRPEEAAPLLAEARELFTDMGATVWLQRLDAVAPTPVPPLSATRHPRRRPRRASCAR